MFLAASLQVAIAQLAARRPSLGQASLGLAAPRARACANAFCFRGPTSGRPPWASLRLGRVLVPIRFASAAWPRAGLPGPHSTSGACLCQYVSLPRPGLGMPRRALLRLGCLLVPMRFASEAWPRACLAEPRCASGACLCQYVLLPRPGLGQTSMGLAAPRARARAIKALLPKFGRGQAYFCL
eukprot:s3029_g1.t1